MKYRSSQETTSKILVTLLEHKEYAQYDLPKKIGKDYRTVLRHLKEMESRHLIILTRTEPAKKGGKDRKIYRLTLIGLFIILQELSSEELDKKIDEIAKNFAHELPLVFGKWEHFNKHGFREKAISQLKAIPLGHFLFVQYLNNSRFPQYYRQLKTGTTHMFCFLELRMMHNDVVNGKFIEFSIIEDLEFQAKQFEEIERWLRMLMLDVDLRKYVKKEFEWLIRLTSKYLNDLRNIRKLTMKSNGEIF